MSRRSLPFVSVALLATVAGLVACGSAVAAIPAAERQVLVNLYDDTQGGGWVANDNWCSGACPPSGAHAFNAAGTECTWFGVTCDDAQAHVVAVALSGNNLQGSLPGLGGLAELRYFAAADNHLGGWIPALSSLSHLQTLYLSGNALIGTIPSLGGLAELGDVALSDNQLTGSIPDLSTLSSLYSFDVAGNRLDGSMPALTALTNLRAIDVARNEIAGALPSLSLPRLLRFSADHNRLTGTIPSLPASLSAIRIGWNGLSGAVPAAPAALYSPVAFTPSGLCPNPLNTTPSGNDAGWSLATGFAPWWADPFAGNRCDDLFSASFE